jgi:hypothetical protein
MAKWDIYYLLLKHGADPLKGKEIFALETRTSSCNDEPTYISGDDYINEDGELTSGGYYSSSDATYTKECRTWVKEVSVLDYIKSTFGENSTKFIKTNNYLDLYFYKKYPNVIKENEDHLSIIAIKNEILKKNFGNVNLFV